MDERQLSQRLHDAAESAAAQAPPAGFDHADVLAGSRRAGTRARRRLAGGISAGVLVVAVAGLVSAGALSPPAPAPGSSALVGPSPASQNAGGHVDQPFAMSQDRAARQPAQMRAEQSSCGRPDQRLFDQLAAALPAVRAATPRPLSEEISCPSNGRGFEITVDDNGSHGVLRVLLSPSGGGMGPQISNSGALSTSTSSTRDGGSLSVSSAADGDHAPFDDELDTLADTLAEQN
ncbi:MAG TPA: hypothetical protein VGM60_02550 [Pseudonocardia sp.]|uniref:hypothetical protein n=1 Tax=Pseudonocardia sp. TaxID=60912 RepID=UPI002F3FE421